MTVEEVKNTLLKTELKLRKLVLSDAMAGEFKKIYARPIFIKDELFYQIENHTSNKVYHKNLTFAEMINQLPIQNFKQITFEGVGSTLIFFKTKNAYKLKTQTNNIKENEINLNHNKTKNYFINEGDNVPVMVELGIFSKDNKIIRTMYDKFKQINRFIEIIDDVYKNNNLQQITILDFGCGKSYLTFLVYYYFVKIKNIKAKIIGYDIKQDVVENCNKLAKKYGYTGLEFVVSDVEKDKLYEGKIDMVISLHACNTATDFALNFAIKNNVKHIFSVPCCQHEINMSIKGKQQGEFNILLKDGLIKERFSALLTDAIRAEVLRAYGYSVNVLEFVDFAHSPKNIMLRAKLINKQNKNKLKEIETLKNKYSFNQKLMQLVKD